MANDYDGKQARAVLVTCLTCRRSFYMTAVILPCLACEQARAGGRV